MAHVAAASGTPGATREGRAGTAGHQHLLVLGLCFATIVFDGYDLIVYGSVIPDLLEYEPWGLTPQRVGTIGSIALAGMLVGALAVGTLTDLIGRRKVLLVCLVWFSVAMGLCAVAPSAGLFAACRFLAGLGLGGVMPTTVALTVEWAPKDRHHLFNALMFSGYSVGGVLAALLAIWFLPDYGFRVLFALGALPLITVVPLAFRYLPESRDFQPRAEKSVVSGAGGLRRALPTTLFTRQRLVASVLFPLASFCGLLLVYGLNTWLPKIMQKAGYPLTSALAFLVMLNVGAVIGALGGSAVADRLGPKQVTAAGFLVAAGSVLLMSQGLSIGTLYVVVAAAGLGSVGTQILLNGYVASYYGPEHRASALGWTLGIGRLGAILGPTVGGFLLASSLGVDWNFYTFAVAAVAGAILVALVPPALGGTSPGYAESGPSDRTGSDEKDR
ncbi:MAG TPA: aromatic acid/H+ symport family MFS transporter [Acidimicrobiia bacterium]|nr:aromatic acid/H+ symport family MFS transporter [Acidimicrobiia bacterium]